MPIAQDFAESRAAASSLGSGGSAPREKALNRFPNSTILVAQPQRRYDAVGFENAAPEFIECIDAELAHRRLAPHNKDDLSCSKSGR